MKTFLYYLELTLTTLIGACGIAMIIAGICYSNIVPIVLGVSAILMAAIVLIEDKR